MSNIYKIYVVIALITVVFTGHSQESLLLGELKLDEIKPAGRTDGVKKAYIYGFKYKKKGNYKDSTLKAFHDYSTKGELLVKKHFTSGKNARTFTKSYNYDADGNVIAFDYLIQSNQEVIGQSADFMYYNNVVTRQVISLANIAYEYHEDGRIKSKAYYYNNKGEIDSEPWKIYFMYDEQKNLIHADPDQKSTAQTSFYNDTGELIRHDYYPGVAYTIYEYDSLGNCTKQVDYELGKKDWDSTQVFFQYDTENRLVRTGSISKKGKQLVEQDWIYNSSGQLVSEIFYKKNKPRYLYRYYFDYFKE